MFKHQKIKKLLKAGIAFQTHESTKLGNSEKFVFWCASQDCNKNNACHRQSKHQLLQKINKDTETHVRNDHVHTNSLLET